MPYFPIADTDADSGGPDDYLSQDYLDRLDELGLRLNGTNEDNERIRAIRSFMDPAFTSPGEMDVAERIFFAWSQSDAARLGNTDENLRNAERFLYGLNASTNGNLLQMMYIKDAAIPYEAAKAVAQQLEAHGSPGFEMWLRSNKNNPTSKPSLEAVYWAQRGMKSGLLLMIKDKSGNFIVPHPEQRFKNSSQPKGLQDMRDTVLRLH